MRDCGVLFPSVVDECCCGFFLVSFALVVVVVGCFLTVFVFELVVDIVVVNVDATLLVFVIVIGPNNNFTNFNSLCSSGRTEKI